MSAALHQIAVIFIGILAGFVCRKLKVLSEEGTATVSNIVVKIILPFYLFSAILNSGASISSSRPALFSNRLFLAVCKNWNALIVSALYPLSASRRAMACIRNVFPSPVPP